VKEKNIEDWLTQLKNPSECESGREQAVMTAIKSGLSASQQSSELDQLALQRLHRRIEQEGLYQQAKYQQPKVKRGRNLHRYGYAAAVLLGVAIMLDLSVFKGPTRQALRSAADSDSAQFKMMAASPQMRKDIAEEEMIESRAEAMSGEQYLADAAKNEAAEMSSAMAKRDRVAAAPQENEQQQAARQKGGVVAYRLVVTDKQWQTLSELAGEGISLKQGANAGHWLLQLNSEADAQRWQQALPESGRNKPWPIAQRIDIKLEIVEAQRGDRNE
jgi:hypothetical protein